MKKMYSKINAPHFENRQTYLNEERTHNICKNRGFLCLEITLVSFIFPYKELRGTFLFLLPVKSEIYDLRSHWSTISALKN